MLRTILIAALLLSVLAPVRASACLQDRNLDGVISDLEQADRDCDGVIGILDLAGFGALFLQHVPGPPTPTAVPTATAAPTDTATPSATPSDTPSPLPTATDTPTQAPTPTLTPVPTATPSPTPSAVPTATALPLAELLIAERGAHPAYHEISLAAPMSGWSWGMHSTEDAPSEGPGFGSVTVWMAAQRDASQMGLALNARVAIRRMRLYVLKSGAWHLAYDGLPQWMVTANPETNGDYTDVGHVVEPDGSWSFAFPPNRSLHMAQNSPGYLVAGASGVAVIIDARVLGPDAALTRWAANGGADWKAPDGSCSVICGAAGIGRYGLLTTSWRSYTMLSTTLSDAGVRANPPL